MKIFIFLISFTILNATYYPNFTQYELNNIEKYFGKIAKNRVSDYSKSINIFRNYSKNKQLIKVNIYLNQLLPQVDILNQKKRDYWETPKEFLTIGYGDCEDYAIIKYFTLLKLGFAKEKLYLTAVREKFRGKYHLVLSYFEDKNKSPLILDNLSFRILDLETRKDLKVDMFINSNGVYKLNEKKRLIKVAKVSSKFNELLKRVKKEG